MYISPLSLSAAEDDAEKPIDFRDVEENFEKLLLWEPPTESGNWDGGFADDSAEAPQLLPPDSTFN